MEQKQLGIDIGGTKIHLGVVQEGQVLEERRIPTSARASQEQLLLELKQAIAPFISEDIAGIGMGVPGLVDEEEGIVYNAQNIGSFEKVALKQEIERHFGKPVYLTNDANCFILGEKAFGKARSLNNAVGLTLGTGLGTGILIEGKLYSGAYACAGELGGIPYLDRTLEDYCSGKFFHASLNSSGSQAFERAKRGDRQALQVFEEFGTHLSHALKLVLYTYAPEGIILGGSISRGYQFFKDSLYEGLQSFPYTLITGQLQIQVSELDNAAVLGAAELFSRRHAAFLGGGKGLRQEFGG